MKIDEIRLYKTPLDPEYKNIIDFNNYNSNISPIGMYYSMIDNFYSTDKVVISSVGRSLKINNKMTSINIFKSYSEIIDYNYMIIKSENRYFYFFILGLYSENDNELNPSCMLTIKWDAWANNIDKFTNTNIQSLINQRHMDRFDENRTPIWRKNSNEVDLKHFNTISDINDRYRVLFVKLSLNKTGDGDNIKDPLNIIDIKLKGNVFAQLDDYNTAEDGLKIENRKLKDSSLLIDKQNRYILYCPLALYDVFEQKYVDAFFNSDNLYFNATFERELLSGKDIRNGTGIITGGSFSSYVNNILKYHIYGADTMYIDNLDLTFHSPVAYTVTNNEVFFEAPLFELIMDLGVPLYTFINIESGKVGTITVEIDDSATQVTGVYDVIIPSIYFDDKVVYNKVDTFDYKTKIGLQEQITEYSFLAQGQYNFYIEPKMYMYPYKYISLYFNNKFNIISPTIKNGNTPFKIYKNYNSNQPRILISEGTNNEVIYEYVNNAGTLSYSVRALDDYMLRNGAVKDVALGFGTLLSQLRIGDNIANGISSMYTHQYMKGAQHFSSALQEQISDIGNWVIEYQNRKQLSKTPASISSASFAEDDYDYQDREIYLISSISENTDMFNAFLKNYYLYGYEYNNVDNICYNSRLYFDYIKTINCRLNISMNNDDREEIENIFNNGVFKNHITFTEDYILFDPTFSRDGSKNNCELTLADFSEMEV